MALWVLAICAARSSAQSVRAEDAAPRRALLLENLRYAKLPALPGGEPMFAALEAALRSARFEVEVRRDLDLDALITTLDDYQTRCKPGEVSFVYVFGYFSQDLETWVLPVDFDPESKGDMDSRGYLLSQLERGISAKNPFVSLFLIHAVRLSGDTPANVGINLVPSARTWVMASFRPNGAEKEDRLTGAFVKAITTPGLDLTDISAAVKSALAANGEPPPLALSTDPPRFRFQDPVGIVKVNGNDRLKYVLIPPGQFSMGCAPASEAQCRPEEKPRHLVEISKGYWLGQTEVTNLAYSRFKPGWKPKKHITDAGKQGDMPVVDVLWQEAESYCEWTAKGGRLPTEAEWERAARGGKDDEVYPFSDLSTSREKANFLGVAGNDRFVDIAPVEQFDPNAYQLYDMAGNVWEWVLDWYSPTYYTASPARDPRGPDSSDNIKKHVVRGGSYNSDPKTHLRLSFRKPDEGGNNVGFRCLLPETPEVAAGFRN